LQFGKRTQPQAPRTETASNRNLGELGIQGNAAGILGKFSLIRMPPMLTM